MGAEARMGRGPYHALLGVRVRLGEGLAALASQGGPGPALREQQRVARGPPPPGFLGVWGCGVVTAVCPSTPGRADRRGLALHRTRARAAPST